MNILIVGASEDEEGSVCGDFGVKFRIVDSFQSQLEGLADVLLIVVDIELGELVLERIFGVVNVESGVWREEVLDWLKRRLHSWTGG